MSSSTKGLEPAFQGVGQKVGTEIWRIENFQPVPLPKSDYGKFYSGDSYIILRTSPGKGGAYLFDIHFWLGNDTSQDEAEVASMKTVELDAVLRGCSLQYRELQGHESDKFLSCFRPCILPLEGGVASGFKKPEEEFERRMYICRGKRNIRLKQVPFLRSSLNHDDVFILDTEDKIYQFNGANSNIQERAKALEVIQFLKEKYHDGKSDVAIVDGEKLQAETDSGGDWVLFGGFAPIGEKVAIEDDICAEKSPAQLYSIVDGQIESVDGQLSKSILENNKCYLLDSGAEVFVWVGRVTQVDERKTASRAGEEFLVSQNRPKSTRISRVIQGYETHSFKSMFGSWPSGSAPFVAEEGRGKVAALLNKQGGVVKGASKSAPLSEDVPPLLEGGGKTQVWRIDGSAKIQMASDDIGKFYSGDCYIVLYTYHSYERGENYYLCCWIGKESTEEDQIMASKLSTTMYTSLKMRPLLGRIFQGKEPPQFVAIFQPMVVLKGGLSSGYKNYITDKGLNDKTYTIDGVALIRISGTSLHNNIAVQVEAVATSLNSYECFLLQSGSSIFNWHGNEGSFEQQLLVAKVSEFLKPGCTILQTKEGTESSSFWFALGEKLSYTSEEVSSEVVRDPHLFEFSYNKGKFEVEEIYNFSQDDLLTEDILILDTHAEVFVWVGQSVTSEEKQNAFEIGQKYIEMAASLEGLSPNVPLYKVTEGNEPCFFTTYFSWDPAKASANGNSFQKKCMILFGAGHSAQERSNALISGGAAQRISALAALNSAFSSSPSPKAGFPNDRVANVGGSQKAAVVAALSTVLTAGKKRSGDVSPTRPGHEHEVKNRRANEKCNVPESSTTQILRREVGGSNTRTFSRRMADYEDLVLRMGIHQELPKHRNKLKSIRFSADGDAVLSGSIDGEIKLSNPESARVNLSFNSGHSQPLLKAEWMLGENFKIITLSPQQLRLSEIDEAGRVETKVLLHNPRYLCRTIAPGYYNDVFICASNGRVTHVDLREQKARSVFTCSSWTTNKSKSTLMINAIALNPNNHYEMAIGGSDQFARIFDLRHTYGGSSSLSQPVDYFCPPHLVGEDADSIIKGLVFSHLSHLLVSYSDEFIYLFNEDDGLGINPDSVSSLRMTSLATSIKAYKGPRSVSMSFFGPNDNYIVSGSRNFISFWRSKCGKLVRVLETNGVVTNVSSHPHLPVLATCCDTRKKPVLWCPKDIRVASPTNFQIVTEPDEEALGHPRYSMRRIEVEDTDTEEEDSSGTEDSDNTE